MNTTVVIERPNAGPQNAPIQVLGHSGTVLGTAVWDKERQCHCLRLPLESYRAVRRELRTWLGRHEDLSVDFEAVGKGAKAVEDEAHAAQLAADNEAALAKTLDELAALRVTLEKDYVLRSDVEEAREPAVAVAPEVIRGEAFPENAEVRKSRNGDPAHNPDPNDPANHVTGADKPKHQSPAKAAGTKHGAGKKAG